MNFALNTIGCYVRIVTFLHTQICQCCTSASKSNNKVLRRNLSSAPLVSSDDDGSKHYRKFEDSASDVSSGSSLSKSPSPELEREGDSEEEGGGKESFPITLLSLIVHRLDLLIPWESQCWSRSVLDVQWIPSIPDTLNCT